MVLCTLEDQCIWRKWYATAVLPDPCCQLSRLKRFWKSSSSYRAALQVGKPAPLAVLVYERQALDIFSQTDHPTASENKECFAADIPGVFARSLAARAILLFDVVSATLRHRADRRY